MLKTIYFKSSSYTSDLIHHLGRQLISTQSWFIFWNVHFNSLCMHQYHTHLIIYLDFQCLPNYTCKLFLISFLINTFRSSKKKLLIILLNYIKFICQLRTDFPGSSAGKHPPAIQKNPENLIPGSGKSPGKGMTTTQ